jgi:amino acid adenylation domain-containing protein
MIDAMAFRGCPVFFLFPGQGALEVGAGSEVYRSAPVFREELDRCASLLAPLLGIDVRELLFPDPEWAGWAADKLEDTALSQPALFAFEYALAKWWMSKGITPRAMLGHSLGEWTAACLAGVFSLSDALALVTTRGRLLQALPPGRMLAVFLPQHETRQWLSGRLCLAAVNSPSQSVVSGPNDEVDDLMRRLTVQGVGYKRLPARRAFHSGLVEPAIVPFAKAVAERERHPPRIPFFSNLSGDFIADAEAVDPSYWARHLRETVLFAHSVAMLLGEAGGVFVEVGPGETLIRLVRLQGGRDLQERTLPSLPRPGRPPSVLGAGAGLGERQQPLAADGAMQIEGPEVGGWLPAPSTGAPRTALEQTLAACWQRHLPVHEVGIDDDLFALGGDSLAAIRILASVASACGVHVALGDFLEAPTIAGLAARVSAGVTGDEVRADELLARAPVARSGELPLSYGQEQIWFLDRLTWGSSAYHVFVVVEWRGPFSVPALACAADAVVRRHESLRTTFSSVRGQPVARLTVRPSLALPVVDLRGLAEHERDAAAARVVALEVRRPFDLAAGPLLRLAVVRRDREHHLVVATLHHIISDGWSKGVLLRELLTLYETFRHGGRSPLPGLPAQYSDFASWQRQRLGGNRAAALLSYWRGRLLGAPPLELPLDRPRPAAFSFRGTRQWLTVPADALAGVDEVSRSVAATRFMGLLATFQVLLHRVSSQNDFLVGSPISGRVAPELTDLIGLFANILPLRAPLAGDPTFRELLRRVRGLALEAYSHQEMPVQRLIEELEPERDASRNPLYQAVFVLQPPPLPPERLPGVNVAPLTVDPGAAKFDLTLELSEGPAGLHGWFEFCTDLFHRTSLRRLSEHWRALVSAIGRTPDLRISELDLLTPAERHQLAREWNDTAASLPADATIPALFALQVARAPDAVALVQDDETLTYRELDASADSLAQRLVRLGVGPEVVVGISTERSLATIIALLAILEAGGAYLPLDPAYPRERLLMMVRTAGAALAFADEKLRAALGDMEGEGLRLLPLAFNPSSATGARVHPLRGGAAAESLAYVIYTSGSTGRPKPVGATQVGVVRLVHELLSPREVLLHLAPLSFDASTFEIWGALLNGARLVLMPPELSSLAQLGQTLREHQVTMLWLTAGLFHRVTDEHPAALAGLAQLLAGGEALSPSHVERALGVLGSGRLINGYGPTETTTFAACARLDPTGVERRPPIGRPIANTRIHLLDRHLRPVPLGVTGELFVGGPGLARGYLGAPDLTAERFLPDPVGPEAGARLYRTGDLARHLPDGQLDFLGRADRQVKVRGFRIEPGEVETALGAHGGVAEALVAVRSDATGEPLLVAYVVPRAPHPTAADLRAFLASRLPAHMLPGAWAFLDELPLTASGKRDLERLPLPAPGGPPIEQPGVAPRNRVEERIGEIWAEVLGSPARGVHESFFDLGGHSLRALELLHRLGERFQVQVPLSSFLQAPTIAELATTLEATLKSQIAALDEEEVLRMLGQGE